MEITIIGASHVGLVSGAGLAATGHRVRIQDDDRDGCIDGLRHGELPFFESGLQDLISAGLANGRISFHSDPAEAIPYADLIFLCVPTSVESDAPDLSELIRATVLVARYASDGALLVNRSTSPVGTLQMMRELLDVEGAEAIDVATNPQFLAEGSAVADFLAPHRVLVGAWTERAVSLLAEAYRPITDGPLPADVQRLLPSVPARYPLPTLVTTPESAEVAKYAANAFLAVKISFANEMARVSERLGADVEDITRVITADPRIGSEFLRPGLGWGQGRFPRDVPILNETTTVDRLPLRLLATANQINDEQHRWVLNTLQSYLRTLVDRRIALLGLSFKPATDDLRGAPALEIAADLVREGARVVAFDPVVRLVPGSMGNAIELAASPLAAATSADALVLVTEWNEFADLPFAAIRDAMRVPLVVDGRNFLDASAVRAAGLVYVGVGRGQGNVHPLLPPPGDAGPGPGHGPERRSTTPGEHGAPAANGAYGTTALTEPESSPMLLVSGGAAGPSESAAVSVAEPRTDDIDVVEVRVADVAVRVTHAVETGVGAPEPMAVPGSETVMVLPESETVVEPDRVRPQPPPTPVRRRPVQAVVKRLMDLTASLALLLLLSPLLLVVGLAIAVDSRGHVLYVQHRIGRGGHLFRLFKFRTMVVDGHAALAKHLAEDEELQAEWERSRKLRDDPRITRMGKFLRRHSIDELPQLLNVVRGEMSLVGPRPVTPDELQQMGELGPRIVEVRPGLTGLWAVSGRNDTTYRERAVLEHQYATHWNLLMDLRILVRTIPAVIFGRGAY